LSDAWLKKLRADRVVLIDGATGGELRRRGVALSKQAWSGLAAVSHQDVLREIHVDYIRAGADVITTNTFATTRFVLESAGCGDQFKQINERAIDAATQARDAAGRDVAIAGSISCLPPSFETAAYPNTATEQQAYLELAELLAEHGVDLIAVEMMQEDRHARLACEAVHRVGLPFWLGVSCRFDTPRQMLVGFDFPDTPLSVPLSALLPYKPTVVNAMHTAPEIIELALAEIKTQWDGYIGAYPELYEDTLSGPELMSAYTPHQLATFAASWIKKGARVVGGCCGTTPDHIRALRDLIDDRES